MKMFLGGCIFSSYLSVLKAWKTSLQQTLLEVFVGGDDHTNQRVTLMLIPLFLQNLQIVKPTNP